MSGTVDSSEGQAPQRGKPWGDDNPPPRKGRAKGARGRKTIVTEIANETYKVPIDGKTKSVRTIELVLRTLNELAHKGDQRALKECDRLDSQYGVKEQEGGYLVGQEPITDMDFFCRWVEWYNMHVVQPDPPADTDWRP